MGRGGGPRRPLYLPVYPPSGCVQTHGMARRLARRPRVGRRMERFTQQSSNNRQSSISKMDAEPLYCAEQIKVPEGMPEILKEWTKAVIRAQPKDINAWSAESVQNEGCQWRQCEILPVSRNAGTSLKSYSSIKPRSQAKDGFWHKTNRRGKPSSNARAIAFNLWLDQRVVAQASMAGMCTILHSCSTRLWR